MGAKSQGSAAGRSRRACLSEFGDEPLLIARRLQVPVIVGEDRYEAGRFAEAKFGPQLHLLDDGFQHRAACPRFRYCAGDAGGCAGSTASCRAFARTAEFVGPRRCGCAGQWRRAESFLDGVQAGLARAAGNSPAECSCAARGLLWHCAAAEFRFATAHGEHRAGGEAFYRDHHAYTREDVRELLELKQRARPEASLLRRKTPSIWADIFPRLRHSQSCP